MNLKNKKADIFVPDSVNVDAAMARTTHLSIVAHQDDTEISSYHGISECFGIKDRWFSSIVLTDGAGSPRTGIYADYTDDEMQSVRLSEQRKAAYLGEYGIQFQLGYSSSEIKDSSNLQAVNELASILKKMKPDVIYTHNPADKHDTHVAVLLRVLKALRLLDEKERPEFVYGCEVWRDLDWLSDEDKVALDVSRHKNLFASLLGVFDSQISGGKRYDLAAQGRNLSHATYHSSHEVDRSDALSYAIDLSEIVHNEDIEIKEFLSLKIEEFRNDVENRIDKLF